MTRRTLLKSFLTAPAAVAVVAAAEKKPESDWAVKGTPVVFTTDGIARIRSWLCSKFGHSFSGETS
jgi:hypothetical protein